MLVESVASFKAMGTDVQAVVCSPESRRAEAEQALKQVQQLFADVERTVSRFHPESELSHLNASAGRPFQSSELLFRVTKASIEAARSTGGLFDPTILGNLLAAGYDCSFNQMEAQSVAIRRSLRQRDHTWRDVHLDEAHSTISMPAGCGLDLGGIGKGWTVDRASSYLQTFQGFALDAGGDIMVGGAQANGLPWTIGIDDPFKPGRDLRVLELTNRAVCTSSTIKRSWRTSNGMAHHLIDPRTGAPSHSGVVSATVVADSATRAETMTKAALILGPLAGMRFIEKQAGLDGLLVLANGRPIATAGLKAPLHAA